MKFKALLVIILSTINVLVQGQKKMQGCILDKQTKAPLAYAIIDAVHQHYGCYTDTSGLFTLYYLDESDSLRISYMGYKSVYTTAWELQKNAKILLEANPVQLNEVVIISKKIKPKVMEIGYFTKKRYSVLATSYPRNIHAAFISFPEKGNKVFIKSVKFAYELTSCNYPLRIRILKVNANGEPGDDILVENITLPGKKLLKSYIAVLDISKYNIYMPVNGVIVALEWVMDKPPLGRRKLEGLDGPYIGSTKTDKAVSHWIGSYNRPDWDKLQTRTPMSLGLTVVNYDE